MLFPYQIDRHTLSESSWGCLGWVWFEGPMTFLCVGLWIPRGHFVTTHRRTKEGLGKWLEKGTM